MTTQFLSKVERRDEPLTRKLNAVAMDQSLGAPDTSTLRKTKPGFAPFATSSRRPLTQADPEDKPAPGIYEIATTLHTVSSDFYSFYLRIRIQCYLLYAPTAAEQWDVFQVQNRPLQKRFDR